MVSECKMLQCLSRMNLHIKIHYTHAHARACYCTVRHMSEGEHDRLEGECKAVRKYLRGTRPHSSYYLHNKTKKSLQYSSNRVLAVAAVAAAEAAE